MLFWITLIVCAGLTVWAVYMERKNNWDMHWQTLVAILLGICVFIMLIVMACQYIGVDAYCDRMQSRYEALTYQYENNIYDNDNDLGKRDLMVDIQRWNEDLAHHQNIQDDFWVGIFYPNIYDQFEFINLK